MFNSLRYQLISKSCLLFSYSSVKVHDSQAYIYMEMSRERISFNFDPKDMLLVLQMGFSFVRAAVACAILERTSGVGLSFETTASSTCYSAQLLPFYLYLFLDVIGAICHKFGLGTDCHLIPCAGFVETFF